METETLVNPWNRRGPELELWYRHGEDRRDEAGMGEGGPPAGCQALGRRSCFFPTDITLILCRYWVIMAFEGVGMYATPAT